MEGINGPGGPNTIMTNDRPPSDLSPADQRIVDTLVDAGFDADAIESPSPDDRRRADAVTSLFELLEDYPVEDGDDTLVHATLARIDRNEDDRSARMTFASSTTEGGPRRRLRLPDFISVAAVILIGTSVVWPVATHMRQRSIQLGCDSHLRVVGEALGLYVADWGTVPTVRTGLFEFWRPGAKNAINLNPLLDYDYCDASHLHCPGHEGMLGDSYSYQFQTAGRRPSWGSVRVTVLLGDRNPIIDAVVTGRFIQALSASINHGGRGQNVLSSDGSTQWLVQPVVGTRDNIWLPDRVDLPGGIRVTTLRPGDKLTDPADVFLAH